MHGIEFFFRERARSARHVSLTSLGLGAILLGLQLMLLLPGVRTSLAPPARRVVRFGYPGPPRIVEHIELGATGGAQDPLRDVGHVDALPERRGGQGLNPARSSTRPGMGHASLPGLGESEVTIYAQARQRHANVPLVSSDELAIEYMEEPVYPEELREKGIEGRVSLMALVDTAGRVAEVSVVLSSGELAFEQSATDAVRRARFHPYKIEGTPAEVYVIIPYHFTVH